MKLSVVIPCFNESGNINKLVEEFESLSLEFDLELILVDNGSSDSTKSKILSIRKEFVKKVYVEKNLGYGYGVKQGLKVATGEYIGWTHADLQTDPKDLLTAYKLLKENNFPTKVLVKGERKERPLSETVFTGGMSLFESILFKMRIYDIFAQPNVFHKSFYPDLSLAPDGYGLELFCLVRCEALGIDIIRFPVFFNERYQEKPTWNTGLISKIKFSWVIIKESFEIKSQMIK